MRLFDLHCDTPRYIKDNAQQLSTSDGHVSLQKAQFISPFIQVAAIWCTFDSIEKAHSVFNETIQSFDNECRLNNCDIIKTADELKNSIERQENGQSRAGFIYCIEDCGFITSTDVLHKVYDRGVRILIPMWGKTNLLGASHEAEGGLTDLGKYILDEATRIGMILDISHASVKSASQIMDIAEKYSSPVIASHSNSRGRFNHTRNLYTDQIKRLISLGGIIGHSLCPWHLSESGDADVTTVMENIESLIYDAGEDNICFGCDLDGTDLPHGFKDITSLNTICDRLSHRFSPQIADKIQFTNALTKFQQFLK